MEQYINDKEEQASTYPQSFYVTLLIILGIIIAGSGAYLWQNFAAIQELERQTQEFQEQIQELEQKLALKARQKADLANIATWATYENEEYNFSFKHPGFDLECCDINVINQDEAVVAVADQATASPGSTDPFDGFAIRVYTKADGETFDQFVEQRKEQFLLYTLSQARTPSQEDITISGQTGIKLLNYSEFPVEVIYIPIPESQDVMEIAKTDNDPQTKSFDETFTKILSTFTFANSVDTST